MVNLKDITEIKNVFEWLSRPLDNDEYPALSLRDPADKVKSISLGTAEKHTLLLEVDVAMSPTLYEAREIRELVPKIKQAFANTLDSDGLYFIGRYLGRTIIGEHKDYFYVASRLTFEVDFDTQKWKEV